MLIVKKQITAIILSGILIFLVGCSSPPQHPAISKIALGKNLTAEPEVTSFDIRDVVYAVASVSNANGKHSIKFTVTEENVEGRPKGNAVQNKRIDFEGDKPLSLQFLVAYPGEYKVEATLFNAADEPIDSKNVMLTVTGEPLPMEVENEGGVEDGKDRDKEKDRKDKKDSDRDKDRDKDRK